MSQSMIGAPCNCTKCGAAQAEICSVCATRVVKAATKKKSNAEKEVKKPTLRLMVERQEARVMMIAAIPKVGPVRAKAICKRWPSLRQLIRASEDDIAKLAWKKGTIGPELARLVKRVVA